MPLADRFADLSALMEKQEQCVCDTLELEDNLTVLRSDLENCQSDLAKFNHAAKQPNISLIHEMLQNIHQEIVSHRHNWTETIENVFSPNTTSNGLVDEAEQSYLFELILTGIVAGGLFLLLFITGS